MRRESHASVMHVTVTPAPPGRAASNACMLHQLLLSERGFRMRRERFCSASAPHNHKWVDLSSLYIAFPTHSPRRMLMLNTPYDRLSEHRDGSRRCKTRMLHHSGTGHG